jgi:hypothetical protein
VAAAVGWLRPIRHEPRHAQLHRKLDFLLMVQALDVRQQHCLDRRGRFLGELGRL